MSSMTECDMLLSLILVLQIGCRCVPARDHYATALLILEQERRRVEELYVQGLKKLAHKHPPDESSDLGYVYWNSNRGLSLLTFEASSPSHGRRLSAPPKPSPTHTTSSPKRSKPMSSDLCENSSRPTEKSRPWAPYLGIWAQWQRRLILRRRSRIS